MDDYLTFLRPEMLYGLIIVPLIYAFYAWANKKKRRAAIKFSSLGIIKQASGAKKLRWRRHLPFILLVIAIIFIIIGFADPHIPLKQTKKGVNVVLALDVSGSMQADDYKPNRMEAAKGAAQTLVENLHSKDYAGVVLFESGATTSAYLTPFKDQVMEKISGIKVRKGSTALGDGLSMAVDMASSIPNKKKIVILLSDGVSNAGVISPSEAINFAESNEVQVYTVGMGSKEKVVLGRDWLGRPQYAELDEATLKKIAAQTNGEYFKSVNENTLEEIYKTISEDIERKKEKTSIKDWMFAAALLVLLILLYVQYGGKRILQ